MFCKETFYAIACFKVRVGHTLFPLTQQITGNLESSILSSLLLIKAMNNVRRNIHQPVQHLLHANYLGLFAR